MADKGQSKDISSDEVFDFICTNCDAKGKIVEAVRYCLQCKGYCCQTCTDQHATFLVMKDHQLFGASQANQASNQPAKLPEFPTERCYLHVGEVIDKFCEEHNDVCCSSCIDTFHTSCPKKSILSIPDTINMLFKHGDCKQIQSRLRDMMISLNIIGKSKDDKLEALKDMKKEEIKKIIDCQKALESIIRKAGESSIGEIENECKELEKGILKEKLDVEATEDSLKEFVDKLVKVEGNRAEHFVLSKIAEQKILGAESQLFKHKYDGIQLAFKPNQSLMNYLNGLHGIGMIDVKTNIRTGLYEIKESKDISIDLSGDLGVCGSIGCCVTCNNQLLVTHNQTLELIDTQTLKIVKACKLDSTPYGTCCISKNEAGVACDRMIQIVSIRGRRMKTTRQIKTHHGCYGIAARDDKLYVTDKRFSLYIYNTSGEWLKTISQDNAGNQLFSSSRHIAFTKNGDKLYVSDYWNGIVCLDSDGKYLSTINNSDLRGADGVCVDGTGSLLSVNHIPPNVVQFDENGKKIGVVINRLDVLLFPSSVCFDQELNRLFVTIEKCNVVKMFELL